MKKKAFFILMASSLLTISGTKAAELTQVIGENATVTGQTIVSPVVFLACVADTGTYGDERCIEATVAAPLGTSTTLALLKDVQAAQPDALDYIAGANPTPLLEEVVKELQDLSLEINGRPVSFDQAVNDIVKNI